MSDQDQPIPPADTPSPDTVSHDPATPDLAKADARAFMAAAGLKPQAEAQPPGTPTPPISGGSAKAAQGPGGQAVFGAGGVRRPGAKPGLSLTVYIAIAAIVVLVITLSLVAGFSKPKSATGSANSTNILSVPTPNAANTAGLPSQAQQDIKTCSNVINAALEC